VVMVLATHGKTRKGRRANIYFSFLTVSLLFLWFTPFMLFPFLFRLSCLERAVDSHLFRSFFVNVFSFYSVLCTALRSTMSLLCLILLLLLLSDHIILQRREEGRSLDTRVKQLFPLSSEIPISYYTILYHAISYLFMSLEC
jgi:hypothetical protein